MELEYKRIEAFEVKGITFHCVSKWNGLEEWRDADDRKMIVNRPDSGGLAESFRAMLGDSSDPARLVVLTASPDLVALLKA